MNQAYITRNLEIHRRRYGQSLEEGFTRIESHNYHKRPIKYRKPSTLIIGDSIAKGLCRYMDVWDRYFGKHTVNLSIGGDKVEDVI